MPRLDLDDPGRSPREFDDFPGERRRRPRDRPGKLEKAETLRDPLSQRRARLRVLAALVSGGLDAVPTVEEAGPDTLAVRYDQGQEWTIRIAGDRISLDGFPQNPGLEQFAGTVEEKTLLQDLCTAADNIVSLIQSASDRQPTPPPVRYPGAEGQGSEASLGGDQGPVLVPPLGAQPPDMGGFGDSFAAAPPPSGGFPPPGPLGSPGLPPPGPSGPPPFGGAPPGGGPPSGPYGPPPVLAARRRRLRR